MSYELTFLGTSGGPLEYGNCGLLIKPAGISYSQVLESRGSPVVMIDAGSGWKGLAHAIHNNRQESEARGGNFSLPLGCSVLYEDSLEPHEYLAVPRSFPFSDLKGLPYLILRQVFGKIKEVLLTHPHLDHLQALVLNLAGMASDGNKIRVLAAKFTVDALTTHIFNGVIWPDLVLCGTVDLCPLTAGQEIGVANDRYSTTYFEVLHGSVINKGRNLGPYKSLAFLLCDMVDQSKLLVFGDFEADSILGSEMNAHVWAHVAPSVMDGTLKCVVLECSTPSRDPGVNLYGHMTPVHVISELQRLQHVCAKRANSSEGLFLRGLHVILTHVKDSFDGRDPRNQILSEIQQLNYSLGLGLKVSIATNGILVIV